MSLTVLDLFSGIGGFSLGLERAGLTTVAFCEIEPYARRVLARHWPEVPCYDDVRAVSQARLAADGLPRIDVICGGFPCQDISLAGRGAGLTGDRSGLWFEMLRIIREIRPRFAIIENSPALRSRGLEAILGAFSEIGYDAEWHCIPAGAIGAPHRRDRIWIIAYPTGEQHESHCPTNERQAPEKLPFTDFMANGGREGLEIILDREAREFAAALGARQWSAEPSVLRVAYGIPDRKNRITCIGNAIVPQIAEMIGRAILAAEAA